MRLRLTALLAALLSFSTPALATEPVRAAWAGGPTLLIRFGPISILTDPVLGEGPEAFRIFDPNTATPDAAQARLSPLPALAFDRADLVLVSHDHEDHLDRTAVARLGSRIPFVVPAAQESRIRARGVARISALGPGSSHRLSRNGYTVTITAVAGRHSERPELLGVLGEVNGYWLEFRHRRYRRTIYWTGDSFPPADGLPNGLAAPDLFVPHLGGVGAGGRFGHVSMGAEHALRFARIVRPRSILPIHHSTFSLYREPIAVFLAAADGAGIRVERIGEGEEAVVP